MDLEAVICVRVVVPYKKAVPTLTDAPPGNDEGHAEWQAQQESVLSERVAAARHAEEVLVERVRKANAKLGDIVSLSVEEVRER